MSKLEYTPGPWKVEIQQYEDGSHICIAENNGDWLADLGPDVIGTKTGLKQTYDNAELMAMAPRMYELLQKIQTTLVLGGIVALRNDQERVTSELLNLLTELSKPKQ